MNLKLKAVLRFFSHKWNKNGNASLLTTTCVRYKRLHIYHCYCAFWKTWMDLSSQQVFLFFIFYFTSTSRIFRQTLLIDAQWICKYFLKWKKDIRSLLSHIITTVPILGLCNKWDVTIEVVGSILYGGNSGESRSGIPVMVLSVGFCIKFIL